MQSIRSFVSNNRTPLLVGLIVLAIGVGSFPYFTGLNVAIALALSAAVVVATAGAYRLSNRAPITWSEPLQRGRLVTSAAAAFLAVGLAIQLVPYGHGLSNPPVTGEPAWDSAQTRDLMVRTCFACHSNEVDFPWYSRVAPISWAVESHVDEGRAKVNYSEWDRPQREPDEAAETLLEGEMPPSYFTRLVNSDARLTDEERRALIGGLEATFGSEHEGREGREGREDDDDD